MKPSLKVIAIAAAVFLVACGGEGGSSNADAGKVADSAEGNIPDHIDGAAVGQFIATNRGLYLRYADNVRGNRILKLHGSPALSDNWTAIDFFPTLVSYAPTNVYSEKEREISFYWNVDENNPYDPGFRIWGRYSTEVSDEIDIYELDDIYIHKVAAGGIKGPATINPWVIASGSGEPDFSVRRLWQSNGQSSLYTAASDAFTMPAGSQQTSAALLLAHPTAPLLFASDGNKVHIYSANALETTVQLPASGTGAASITQMLWHDGSLWVGYDGKVYRIRDNSGTATEFMQIASAGIDPEEHPGSFCIQGGAILTADGQAKRISDGYRRSWLTQGNLTSRQAFQVADLRASIVEIYCSPNSSERIVFAPASDRKSIRMIEALP